MREVNIGKIIEKHLKMIDEVKLAKTLKRVLLIKTIVTAGLFSGEPLSKIVRQATDKLGISESTIWRVIKFDKAYKQIENDYMEVLEYLKQQRIKEILGESNADTQGSQMDRQDNSGKRIPAGP